ncbi:MAG: hypothetical protein V1845_00855 [bacterium]
MDAIKSIFFNQNRAWIFVVAGLFLIFFIGLKAPVDPDFGWHLTVGRDILANRAIPHLDPYSFTLPEFPWISYSWLSDIFIAATEKYFGLFILSLLFSVFSLAAFWVAARAIKAPPVYQIIGALVTAILSVSVIGVRPQVFSILGLAIVLFILLRWRQNHNTKILFWLPPVFLIWANIHPGFAMGLVLFSIFIAGCAIFAYAKMAPKLPRYKNLIISFFLSLAATFLNPYGPRIWKEIWRTSADFYGRSQLIEWQPLFKTPPSVFLPTLILAAFLLISLFVAKKRDFLFITLSAFFFISALLAWRNLPLFLVASSPLLIISFENIAGIYLTDKIKTPIVIFAIFAITFFIGWRNTKQIWLLDSNPAALAQEAQLPYAATQFLSASHLPLSTNRLLNEYNWGGYILWQLPKTKVFIDGRMPHWQLPDRHIFLDYQILQAAKDIKSTNALIKKYDLNLALIRRDSPLALRLKSAGWQNIYQDATAIILKSPH